MPFQKTEVDIREDYVLESVDPEWLQEGVKSPKHLMLDPEPCILCRACEDVCPWNCIYMLDPGIVEEPGDEANRAQVEYAEAIFVVDDHACTRCSVCVERCPSDCLYYARIPEADGERELARVPVSQKADEDEVA
jgi:formate hydrogenlyase subunit 6/NADH:ubiquinone oxidoreductase subunit I